MVKVFLWILIVWAMGAPGMMYKFGYARGVLETTADFTEARKLHDSAMRRIGICEWSKRIASDIQCGGTERVIKDHQQCEADDEKCS